MVTTACPSRETLLRYSLGMLSGEQQDVLDSHLDSCPDCQAKIMTLDDADDTVIGRLRMPLSSESVLAEPQLQDALAAAMAMPAGPDAGEVDLPPHHAEEGLGLPGRLTANMPEMLGEYRLLEELGHGGMGRVYKALHTKLDRVVAVKVLPRGRVGDQKAIVRFEREMKAVGRLAHPNIVQAYDAREIEDTPVLIMEFVDGLDLAEIVRCVGPLPMAEACELVRQTALALQCAHEHGLVHRDIKPSNIMLAQSGQVKLLDLGLSRFYAEGRTAVSDGTGVSAVPGDEEMTGTGQAMGTADYMAPEQASDSRAVDVRADIYSLGCTLYKLLSGRAPFAGPEHQGTFEKMTAHVQEPVPPIGQLDVDVPDELVAVLDRMLAKDPDDRFATPADVAEALKPFCIDCDLAGLALWAEQDKPVDMAPSQPSTPQPVPLPKPRRRKLAAIAVGLMLLSVGFAFGVIITINRDGRTTKIDVPDGAEVAVSKEGQVDVNLGNEARRAAGTSMTVDITSRPAPAFAAPHEGAMVTLPPYRIEPPDMLQIEMLKQVALPPYRAEAYDVLLIQVLGTLPDQPINDYCLVKAEGTVSLGPAYGTVRVVGMTVEEIQQAIERHLRQILQQPKVSVQLARATGTQPVTGEYLVGPDGTVNLCQYGSVHVAGKTITETKAALEQHLAEYFRSPEVTVDVVAYNSKFYYIITQGRKVGDNVIRVPITGNETVMDALSNVGDSSQLSNKRIWISRPGVDEPHTVKTLFVDYDSITRGGSSTNYQLFPGDRIFIVDRGDGYSAVARPYEKPPVAAKSEGSKTPAVNAVGDVWALRGPWRVVRIEKGENAGAFWKAIIGIDVLGDSFAKFGRLTFDQWGGVRFLDPQSGAIRSMAYNIDPTAIPKAVDLSHDGIPDKKYPTLVLGIYEIDGSRLRMRLSQKLGAVKTEQRPRGFDIDPRSADVLFILERPSGDEKAIVGRWLAVSQIEDGKVLPEGTLCAVVSDPNVDATSMLQRGSDGKWLRTIAGRCLLEATTNPKRITFFAREGKQQSLFGIYKFVGDRLTIAYRVGSPRPEKFASTPGSGVTLLELERTEQPPIPAPAQEGGSPGIRGGEGLDLAATSLSARRKALQGKWKIVRLEKGKGANQTWGQILQSRLAGGRGDWGADPADTDRFEFQQQDPDILVVKGRLAQSRLIRFRIDPGATPKTIDLFELDGHQRGMYRPLGLGIYEIEPDRLKICLTGNVPSLQERAQRPTSFVVDPDSANVLFVLERYTPPEEERTVRGWWEIVTHVKDGQTVSHTGPAIFRRWGFFDDVVTTNEERRLRFVLNAATQPKQITMVGWGEQHLNGIYKLNGDRLTIAYRTNGPRPEKFESTPSSGVTLLELQRAKPTTSPKPDHTKTGKSQVSPSPAKTQTMAGGKAEK
jgi:uncharacterized protein (TIGR03067 family)